MPLQQENSATFNEEYEDENYDNDEDEDDDNDDDVYGENGESELHKYSQSCD